MKKFLLLPVLACICFTTVFAQVPQAINYQAVARDSSGQPIVNRHVGLQFIFHDISANGAIDYQETDTATTNQFGLFVVAVGNGTPVTGTFAGINWGTNSKYLEVDIDVTGGANYVYMNASQLISVPYALYARTGGNAWQNYASYDERVQTNNPPLTLLNDSVWTPRTLNNTEYQIGTAITKSGNDITLAPGTYHISASAPWGWDIPYDSNTNWAFPQAQNQLRIRDIINDTTLLISPSDQVTDTRNNLIGSVLHNTRSLYVEGEITITTSTTIEFQHLINFVVYLSGPVNYDFGIPMNSGEDEVYATLNIQKIN